CCALEADASVPSRTKRRDLLRRITLNMPRMLPVSLVLLALTVSLSAAPLKLGPESPLSSPQLGAAASEQYSPAAAWNGRTGLMTWIDGRGRYPADSWALRHPATRYLRVSPMREDGSLVNPNGTPLVPASTARLASNGSGFMSAYSDDAGIHLLPLGGDGTPAGTPVTLTSYYTYDFELISNGHSYLFVTPAGSSMIWMLLSATGAVQATGSLGTGAIGATAGATAVAGGDYQLAYRTGPCPALPCTPDIHLARIQDDGALFDKQVVRGTDTGTALALASSGNRLLLEILGNSDVRTMVIDLNGNVIAPLQTVVQKQLAIEGRQPAFWDGQNFLVTWPAAPAADQTVADIQIEGLRVSPANAIVDASPAVLANRAASTMSFTNTSLQTVMLWYSMSDVFRRAFISTAELFTTPALKEPAVLSARAQSQIELAAATTQPIRVWREGSLDQHIMLSAGGTIVEAASSSDRDLVDPSVARGGNTILVFWRSLPSTYGLQSVATTGYRTYARRFTADGVAIDPQPVLIFGGDRDYVRIELGTAAAFDGRNFIVLWSGSHWAGDTAQPSIRAVRIAPSGEILDPSPVFIPAPLEMGASSSLRAVWTGRELLVAWSSWSDFSSILTSPPPPPRTALEIVRLDTGSMQVAASRMLWNDIGLS